jgi:hypothetical protein
MKMTGPVPEYLGTKDQYRRKRETFISDENELYLLLTVVRTWRIRYLCFKIEINLSFNEVKYRTPVNGPKDDFAF